jgi:hypothetical protein
MAVPHNLESAVQDHNRQNYHQQQQHNLNLIVIIFWQTLPEMNSALK